MPASCDGTIEGEFASQHRNSKMREEGVSSLARCKFQNYVKEIYHDSDANLALLSGAPFDDPSWWLLSNEQIVKARELINDFAGSRRLLAHAIIAPKQPDWMDEVDKALAVHKPDFWKSYPIGDPFAGVWEYATASPMWEKPHPSKSCRGKFCAATDRYAKKTNAPVYRGSHRHGSIAPNDDRCMWSHGGCSQAAT
jgi:hypothetical protein